MNGTGSKFWIGMVLGIIGMVIMLILVPIIRDLAVGVTVKNALNILEREGYVAYSNPEGELITKGVLPETADAYDLGNVNYEWKNLYLGDAGGIVLGTAQDVNLYRSAANVLKTDDSLEIAGTLKVDDISELTAGANVTFGSEIEALQLLNIIARDADATNTVQDPPPLRLTGHYWDGAASVKRILDLAHNITSTAPSSYLDISIAGTRVAAITDGGVLKIDNIDELTAGANVTFASDIDIGANRLKTSNYLLKEGSLWGLVVRTAADDAYGDIEARYGRIRTGIEFYDTTSSFTAAKTDGSYTVFRAKDTGVGSVEIARMVGAAEPFFKLVSLGYGVKTITADYTAAYDAVIRCDASAGAFTVSLPTASGITGKAYLIKKVDSSANAITIDPYGTETIDGAATITLASQYDTVIIVSDGTNWMKF